MLVEAEEMVAIGKPPSPSPPITADPIADMADSLGQGVKGDFDSEREVEEVGSDKGDEIRVDGTDNDASEDDTNIAATINIPDDFLQSLSAVEFGTDGFDEDGEAGSDDGWSTDDGGLSEGGDVDDILDDSGDQGNDSDGSYSET